MTFMEPVISNCNNIFAGLFKDERPDKITNINQLDEETLERINSLNQVEDESHNNNNVV